MVNVGVPCCTERRGREELRWTQGSLKDFLCMHFNQPIEQGSNVKLGSSFKGRNLERVGGIRIDWTSKLEDHLLLKGSSKKTVAIFHHASFLKYQQRYVLFIKQVMVNLSDEAA